jgi:hypothetical protein
MARQFDGFNATHLLLLRCLEGELISGSGSWERTNDQIESFLSSRSCIIDARRQLQAAAGGYCQAGVIGKKRGREENPAKRARRMQESNTSCTGKDLVRRELERRWEQHCHIFETVRLPFVPLLVACRGRLQTIGQDVLGVCDDDGNDNSHGSSLQEKPRDSEAELTLHLSRLQLWEKLCLTVAHAIAPVLDPRCTREATVPARERGRGPRAS